MMSSDVDLIIRNGTIVDGTGSAPYQADIAIHRGRIQAIGANLRVRAEDDIDARGEIVTPGFVDIHTHYDGQVTWEDRVTPSSSHGVTTVLMGNCGVGFAPCKPEDRERLVHLMEGVEDLPEVVLTTGLAWNWESFPDYLNSLESRQYDIDIAAQLPHAALRVYVMGERASAREAATAEDREAMARLAEEAISAGALGFATSRTINHRASDGSLIPTLSAPEEELASIGAALQRKGRGVLQVVSDFDDVDRELAMLHRVIQQCRRPLSISLMQWHNSPRKWEHILEWVARCNDEGLAVKAQVAGRPIGLLMGFELSYHPFVFTPTFKTLQHLSPLERRAALQRPEVRARIVGETPEPSDFPGESLLRQWDLMYPMGESPDYEPGPEKRVSTIAAARGVSPAEAAYDLMLEQDAQAVLMLPASNYAEGNLDAAHRMLSNPHSVFGLGDGGAHLGILCDASSPTHMLSYWTRDRQRGERLSLESVVRGLSFDTAQAVGLTDRGLLKPGYKADINVIDHDRLQLHPPRVRYDLPAGGRRVVQDATGYTATVVSGVITRRDGQVTPSLPGRLVRG